MNRYLSIPLFAVMMSIMSCSSSTTIINSNTIDLELYAFESLDSLITQDPRPVAVFMHAPWCQFCKNMEQTTLTNSEVIDILNESYYFISFDGEQKKDVRFRNYNFKYMPTGRNSGTHELANSLGAIDGELTYPSFVILDADYNITFQHNAFLDEKQMISILIEGLKGD